MTGHPDTGAPVGGNGVPHWEEMLLMAASSLEMTGLAYVGADMVLDHVLAKPGSRVDRAQKNL